MASSMSNLVNNLAEVIYKIECRYKHKNLKLMELNTAIAIAFLITQTLKMI